jgi:PPOX class probable F420-dependent enzyme
MALTPDEDAFLRDHRWALVGTVAPSGTPQVTMVAYHWDGHDAVVSTRATAAKWRNLQRAPRMSLTVTDDQRYLTLTGAADLIDSDPDRHELTRRLQASLLPEHAALLEADVVQGLDRAGRVVIRLRPERAVGRI